MATGDTLLILTTLMNEPPASAGASPDTRNAHAVLDFDAAANENALFRGILPRNYGGGGITVYVHYAMSSATTGSVIWNTAFERIGDGAQDIDADGFAAAIALTHAVPATSGNVAVAALAHTNGAQIDSIVVGESFRLKVTRDAAAAGDDATGDAELTAIELKET